MQRGEFQQMGEAVPELERDAPVLWEVEKALLKALEKRGLLTLTEQVQCEKLLEERKNRKYVSPPL